MNNKTRTFSKSDRELFLGAMNWDDLEDNEPVIRYFANDAIAVADPYGCEITLFDADGFPEEYRLPIKTFSNQTVARVFLSGLPYTLDVVFVEKLCGFPVNKVVSA